MADRANMRNAADPKQVNNAAKREKLARENELADLRSVLSTPIGRRFAWRLLDHCRLFGSTFDHNASKGAYNSGRQDVGHFLIAEINDADPRMLVQMMQESAEREIIRNGVVDAQDTPSASAAATQEKSDAQE